MQLLYRASRSPLRLQVFASLAASLGFVCVPPLRALQSPLISPPQLHCPVKKFPTIPPPRATHSPTRPRPYPPTSSSPSCHHPSLLRRRLLLLSSPREVAACPPPFHALSSIHFPAPVSVVRSQRPSLPSSASTTLQEEVSRRRLVSNATKVTAAPRMEAGAREVLTLLLEAPDPEVGERLRRCLRFPWS